MFNLGPEEIVLILVIALIVFGPKRLPEIGRTVGRVLNEFRKVQDEVRDMVRFDLSDRAEPEPDPEPPVTTPVTTPVATTAPEPDVDGPSVEQGEPAATDNGHRSDAIDDGDGRPDDASRTTAEEGGTP